MKLTFKIFAALLSLLGLAGTWYLSSFESPLINESAANPQEVSTEAKPLEVFCPGPLVQLGGKSGTELGSIDLVGSATLRAIAAQDALVSEPSEKVESGQLIQMATADQSTNALTAIQTQLIDQGRMSGLAATNCDQPLSEGWLLNGMAGPGYESVLLVANPNSVEVQVQLAFVLPTEEVPHLLTLAPFAQTQLSLASFVEAEPMFAVRFASSGPKISLALQNRASSGLSATGVELKTPSVAASTRHVIPGFENLASLLAQTKLRLYNSGEVATTVDVALMGSATTSDVVRVELEAKAFKEVLLDLKAGEYLVIVDSKQPIHAELLSPYVSQGVDFAWISSAENFMGDLTIAVPNFESKLALANLNDSAISIDVTNGVGVQRVEVPPRGQVTLRVIGPSVKVSSTAEYFANLSVFSPKGYAVINPRENANLGSDIEVLVR